MEVEVDTMTPKRFRYHFTNTMNADAVRQRTSATTSLQPAG